MKTYVTTTLNHRFIGHVMGDPMESSLKNSSPNTSSETMTSSNLTPPIDHLPSIAGALAHISSVATAGIGAPNNVMEMSQDASQTSMRKSSARNSLPEISSNDLTRVSGDSRKRRGTSFLHLNIPEHSGWTAGIMGSAPTSHLHGITQHLHLPTFTLTPAASDGTNRKFSFAMGLRRLSQTTLHRSESMVSLCFRSLAQFISDDNLAGLQGFLDNKRVQVDDHDENGVTPLIIAASKGKLSFVREFINHGADVNFEDGDNWSSLLFAAKEGFLDICIELLDHGADIEHKDMGGWTALMWATYKGRVEVVAMLLERNAEVNAAGNFHISSLLWAAGRGQTEILKDLLRHGAKVNMGDKYGTSALVWASRKGYTEIVECLLNAGANVDTAGMYSWTALLVATLGNHVDVVTLLLGHKPNVNALDKDGCTALTIACKEGYHEIALALLNVGAYINIQDRNGDTNLIHAVKGGHRSVVEQLLKKYADVDICGKDKKTAVYWAVEKGNFNMAKLLLTANPDLELPTKDGDTALLRSVRIRNADIVQLLLDKKAKVSAADKKGDTALHVAMRARSKGIVEVLLRNPKNSQLLYRPNRSGETPYNIDINHQKTILGQIFGARRLNTNEDNENMLGYDLYSSALADILSEPSLSMPITVGLYAKWGSGKSFLLDKLREEMKNFARQWVDPAFQFTSLLFLIVLHIALIVGVAIGLATQSWIIGLACGGGLVIFTYTFLVFAWYGSQKFDWYWPYNFMVALTRKLNATRLVLQVMFCHPPGSQWSDGLGAQPIRFYFTDQTRVSSTSGGENSVVQMLGSLYDSIENDYGSFSTRLYRAFRPKSAKSTSTWRWRRLCCIPFFIIFELSFACLLVGLTILTIYLIDLPAYANSGSVTIDQMTAQVILITIGLLLGVGLLSNLYTWGQMLRALFFSQRRHLQKTIARVDTLKSEGFLQALRTEVTLMTDMVKCLDSFTGQQTRLTVIVDGLDSCEQDKVLLVLDAVHMLFSDSSSPFIVILAIDPHIISKAVELNSHRLFSESSIGGHDYLRNMVHLPFFLQNSGLRNVKVAQQTAAHSRKGPATTWNENEENHNFGASTSVLTGSTRRMSTESGMSSSEKLKIPSRKGSRKLKVSESIASSLGSNINKVGGAQDLTKMLLTDDYFSDVNPRSMRRLMNVVYVTGRLLKAFQIDFNWYHLASWVNITEQWPFRTSWLILHYDTCDDQCEDTTSLKSMYDKIRPQIPSSKEVEPLLEMDRDERKFDVFLTFHRSSLLVSDLKVFLPFTINLDPYLKKVIKEEQQNLDDSAALLNQQYGQTAASQMAGMVSPWPQAVNAGNTSNWPGSGKTSVLRRQRPPPAKAMIGQTDNAMMYPQGSMMGWPPQAWMGVQDLNMARSTNYPPLHPTTQLPPDVLETKLSNLNVDGVCNLFGKIEDLNSAMVAKYLSIIRENNINGRVLLHCDLDELKKILQMSFGDWEMFRILVVSLREYELTTVTHAEEMNAKNVRFAVPSHHAPTNVQQERKAGSSKSSSRDEKDKLSRSDSRQANKQSVMEKQVTLEEQMICGALQTLNEEACEDVLDEAEEQIENKSSDLDTAAGRYRTSSQCSNTLDLPMETDVILLQASPLNHPYWQPVTISVGECNSASSSLCGTPVSHRKRQDNTKPLLPPTKMDTSSSSRHTLLHRTSSGNKGKLRSRPSSLSVPDDHGSVVLIDHLTPPASPKHHVAFRSNSAEDDVANSPKPSSLISNITSSLKLKRSNASLNENASESVSPTLLGTPASSIEALNRLRDRIMRTVVAPVSSSLEGKGEVESDDESTPLVSEIATPTTEDFSPTRFLNRGYTLSPSIGRSSSEFGLEADNGNPSLLQVDDNTAAEHLSSCGSSISLSNVLEPASNYYHLVAVSGSMSSVESLCGGSQEHLSEGDIQLRKKSLSGHFSRQDALDRSESNKEGKEDGSNPETTV